MNIPLPQTNTVDIFSFGFSKGLLRSIPQGQNPLVYDMIEDRMSILIPGSDTIATLIPGLPEVKINV